VRAAAGLTVFLLHALGGSARSFDLVRARLPGVETVALDLPGFGGAVDADRFAVADMAAGVIAAVAERAPERWMLVGHSMGGKVAAAVARAAADGDAPAGLAGLVLLAASPPAPEPMAERRRADMLGWVAAGPIGDRDARAFVDANTAQALPTPLRATAAADVRRSSRRAWAAWLEHGSREDWRARVGVLPYPALIVAGAADGDLGEDAQRRLNVPHYADARVEAVAGAAHLLPLEAPDAVAATIRRWWARGQ
jgi:pimeloyl-ACP methyl ester carboxylesterase